MGQLLQFPPKSLPQPAWARENVAERVVAIVNSGYWEDISAAALRAYEKRIATQREP